MKAKPTHRAPGRRARPVGPAVTALVLVVGLIFLGTFVFPTRSFLAQRGAIADAKEELTVLDRQNKVLADRAARLENDAEIERLAREQYNLVKPGEEAYALLPATGATATPTPTPTVPPEASVTTKVRSGDHNLVRRAWDAVTGLF